MVVRLDFNYDPQTGRIIPRPNGTSGEGYMAYGDESDWVQNIAQDYQGYIGGSPSVAPTTTLAPQTSAPGWLSNIGALAGGLGTLIFGVRSAIDGVPNAINYPAGFVPDPQNPNAPRYNQYGVPYQPGAPGTVPGFGSGFLEKPVIGNLTGTHLLLLAAAGIGIVIVARH